MSQLEAKETKESKDMQPLSKLEREKNIVLIKQQRIEDEKYRAMKAFVEWTRDDMPFKLEYVYPSWLPKDFIAEFAPKVKELGYGEDEVLIRQHEYR